MTRKVFANSMVAHVWAQQNQTEGRSSNGNFYFDGRALYSYGRHFPCAVFSHWRDENGRTIVLTNEGRYSVSTSRHMSDMRRALHGLPVTQVEIPAESIRAYASICNANLETFGDVLRRIVTEICAANRATILENVEAATRRIRATGGRHKYGPDRGKAWSVPAIEARTVHEAAAYREGDWNRFRWSLDKAATALASHDMFARFVKAKPLARKGETSLDTLERMRLEAAATAAKAKADKDAKAAASQRATIRKAISAANMKAAATQLRIWGLIQAEAKAAISRPMFPMVTVPAIEPAEVATRHGIDWKAARLEVNHTALLAAVNKSAVARFKRLDSTAAAFLKRHGKAIDAALKRLHMLKEAHNAYQALMPRFEDRNRVTRDYLAVVGGRSCTTEMMQACVNIAFANGRTEEAAAILSRLQIHLATNESDRTYRMGRLILDRYRTGANLYAAPWNRPAAPKVTLEAWTAGTGGMNQPHLGTAVRRNGSRLETSRGAEAPFAQAVAIFRLAQHCRHAGTYWTADKEEVRAGHFTLRGINSNGDVTIGCHHIAFTEMQRLAVREVPEVVKPRFPVPAVI